MQSSCSLHRGSLCYVLPANGIIMNSIFHGTQKLKDSSWEVPACYSPIFQFCWYRINTFTIIPTYASKDTENKLDRWMQFNPTLSFIATKSRSLPYVLMKSFSPRPNCLLQNIIKIGPMYVNGGGFPDFAFLKGIYFLSSTCSLFYIYIMSWLFAWFLSISVNGKAKEDQRKKGLRLHVVPDPGRQ